MGTKDEQAAPSSAALIGSGILPGLIMITEGNEVQLGDVVAAAFDRSGLSLENWNAQDDQIRESLLNAEIEILKASAAAAEKEKADKEAAAIEQAKEKAGFVEVVLLRDSNLGAVGDLVKVSKLDLDTYKNHGFIDDHAAAIKHAKSVKAKTKAKQ